MRAQVFLFCLLVALGFISLSERIAVSQVCNSRNPLPVRVQGQIRFAAGAQPAEHVMVRLESFHGGVLNELVTDNTGKYQFSGLGPEYYVVTVHLNGYIDQRREVDLCTASSAYELFQLAPEKRGVETRTSRNASVTAPRSTSTVVNANVPEEAQKRFENAQAELVKGNIEAGITILERLVSLYPKFVEAQLRLGTAFMDLKQWEKAEQTLKKTIEIDRRTANAYFALGEIYLRQRKYQLAERSLQEGLAIESRSAQSHLTLARAYWEETAGVKDEAILKVSLERSYAEVNQALRLDPNFANAHLLKGNLYFKARRGAEALREFEEYLRLEPRGQYAEQARSLTEKIRKALAEQKMP
jgi:tetratricopeptide (TPR) repeat protein